MNKQIYLLVLAIIAMVGFSCKPSNTATKTFEYQNPITSGIDTNGLRDCQILRDGDWWYMTGTAYPHWPHQETEDNLNKGVPLYKSKDLLNWEFIKYIVERPGSDKWYYRRFWAPEIQKIDGKYYAIFNCKNSELGFTSQNTGYAVADHIEGPYTVVTEEKPLTKGNDLTFFEDEDGSVYAFWNQGRDHGIRLAKVDLTTATLLTEPISAIKPAKVDFGYDENGELLMDTLKNGRIKPLVTKYYDWDAIGIEGAYVIKNEGTYYLFYSSWTRGYEIGYATSKNIEGPWTKHPDNPFYGAVNKELCEERGFECEHDENNPFTNVGHNEVFIGPDGRYWLSCHGIIPGKSPMPVMDPIWFDEEGNLQSAGPTYTKQIIKLK